MHHHPERHTTDRIGWLRAAVLGANDGILSVAGLLVGVAAADADRSAVLLAGAAGVTAGALSMAAGEYVSVSSQLDAENADRSREAAELKADPAGELRELTQIYVGRGLDEPLARQVAERMTEHDALAAHFRDELHLTEVTTARPVQAAISSAAAFAVGSALPIGVAAVAPASSIAVAVSVATVLSLAALGGLSGWIGKASPVRGATRVAAWGVMAMAVTAAVGWLFGVSVG